MSLVEEATGNKQEIVRSDAIYTGFWFEHI